MIAAVLLVALAAEITTPTVPEPAASALLQVRRVYVDRLTGGETAAQIRELLMNALDAAKLFVITENDQRADAFLRGAAEDLIYTDKFNSAESIGARTNTGRGRSGSGTTAQGGAYGGLSLSDSESVHIEERKHEAMAAVRLVTKDGDVIWSTTQESNGGKFRGASADVADKVTKQLLADIERARKTKVLP